MTKNDFLHRELWGFTVGAAFQRANVYQPSVINKQKKEFKAALQDKIKDIADAYKSITPTDKRHIDHIKQIMLFAESYSDILQGGTLSFGVSQKLFNLHLKYLWCLEEIIEPPHFPIDRIIQIELNKEAKEYDIPRQPIINWTQMTTEKEYNTVIDFARTVRSKSPYNSLAVMELNLFDRRNNDQK